MRHCSKRNKAKAWAMTYGKKKIERCAMLGLLFRAQASGICGVALSQIEAIRSQPAEIPQQKIKKAMAIAKTIIDQNVAIARAKLEIMG